MEEDLWRQCVRWLIDAGVLPIQHKTTYPDAHIFDLAQTLRDGVVLCNLLNAIIPGAINLNSINIRPQMLQFLCIQNLRTVIRSLQTVFGFTQTELFLPHDLFNVENFKQVLKVLSTLSHSPAAIARFRPFPESQQRSSPQRSDDEEIYKNLSDLASERELADEDDLYDSVPTEEKEEGIYGKIVGRKKPLPALKDTRSHCVDEIVDTERNYVTHLEMVQRKFIDRLRGDVMTEKDIRKVFSNLEQLLPIHKDFLKSLEKAVSNNMLKLSQPFLSFKDRFLKYGVYCTTLQEAVAYLAELMKNDVIRAEVENLQNNAGPNKFKLRELLYVSMQRILKYHLLVRELYKHTSESHADKADLGKALEGMQELSHYVNEVKRDSEMLQNINKVQSCLVDYTVQLPLSSYGRLLKDGELKIKSTNDNRSKQRFTYLFDQALFMTSIRHETYKLKDLVRLEDYVLEELPSTRATKWSWSWSLRDKHGTHGYILSAKTKSDKGKWLEHIKSAFEVINPSALSGKRHTFKMRTFEEPTYCSHCNKLLLGSFFQGYYCERFNKACHTRCLSDTWKSIADSVNSNGSPHVHRMLPGNVGGLYRAVGDYNGRPPPPFEGAASISFSVGDQIQVEERKTTDWWLGRTISSYDRRGFFPASHVTPVDPIHDIIAVPPFPNFKSPSGIQMEDTDWYAGTMQREEAEKFLEGKPSGAFLVRNNNDQLAISLMFNKDIKHIRIHRSQNMFYVAECKNFKSVQELVKFYQENLMNTSFLGLDTSLKYPYRDPKFFPTAPHLRTTTHRNSLPGPPPTAHPPTLYRGQTFSHMQPTDMWRQVNGESERSQTAASGQSLTIVGQGQVLYDFEPRSSQELGLKANQLVNIINKAGDEQGWWKGEFNGKIGYFPATFIRELHGNFAKISLR